MGSSAGFRRRPRRGSLQFWPRKRASRIYPKIRNWGTSKDVKLMGFAGYKACMSHVLVVDNKPKSPTKGEEVRIPVTILETPPVKVLGLRLHSSSVYGSKVLGEVWSDDLSLDLARRLTLPKKRKSEESLKKLQEKLESASNVSVLVYTQPRSTSLNKKKPEVMEMAIGGSNVNEKFDYAKSILGQEVSLSSVFKDGEMIDIHAVTKGKGVQGPVKRFGVSILHRKSHSDGRRKPGTLGNWNAANWLWRVPMSGQMGFNTRTEYNKQILKIGNIQEQDVNPKGGIVNYGLVKGDYILIAGSIPGPKKRLIRFTLAKRSDGHAQPVEIAYISRESQQR